MSRPRDLGLRFWDLVGVGSGVKGEGFPKSRFLRLPVRHGKRAKIACMLTWWVSRRVIWAVLYCTLV
jgi:hypothetical protein